VGLVMSNLPLIYYLFARLTQHVEEQRHMDAALTQAKAERAMCERSMELKEQIRRERHELKNHYFRLQVLARQGRYEELSAELDERIGAVNDTLRDIDTGCTYLDFLLSQKEAAARDAGVAFRVDVALSEDLTFDETAAGTALGNLIDNALEASAGEEEPDVTVTLRSVRGYLHCQVTNHVSSDVLSENPDLHTTKEDAGAHGYGLKIVRRAIEEAEGTLDLSVKDGRFVASFMLPCSYGTVGPEVPVI